jgi:D-inositol-3-phosphate glycosyltransferase
MTKLLVISDAGQDTGFERVTRAICEHLHDTGDYRIVQRGIGYSEATAVRKYPWTVKAANGDVGDPVGVLNFESWLEEDKPDALLVVQDAWWLTAFMSYKPRALPTVAYIPVDCPNLKWNHAMGVGACAEVASYTQFGAVEAAAGVREAIDIFWEGNKHVEDAHSRDIGYLQLPNGPMLLDARMDRLNRYQNPGNWNVIPHALDRGVFEPRDRDQAREQWGFPKDAFIVLNVSTNQFRKRLDLTIRAFAHLYARRKDALLVLHCAGGDFDGWDLLQLARYYGVEGRVATIHHRMPKLTDEQLCWLYNTADVQINTSGGEGWGLTAFEGAACGIPQVVPDWSATRELWAEHGTLIRVADWRNEPKLLNTAHAIIDPLDAGRILYEFAEDPAHRARWAEKALAQADRQVTWEAVGAAFDTLITRAITEPDPEPLGFRDLFNNREVGVRSELAGKVAF